MFATQYCCICVCDRCGSRDRSPVRYRSRGPLLALSHSHSPAGTQARAQQRIKTRSALRSPENYHQPQRRLLGKTPPLPPYSRSPSSERYGHVSAELKGHEVPVTKCQRERSRSPVAYSSRKIVGTHTPLPPSPRQKVRNSYENKYSASPIQKQNSPPPKAYDLSSDKHQSPRWSRSRSGSVNVKYSSRSPVHRIDSHSSSSTSPPRYAKSPPPGRNSPSITVKREADSPGSSQIKPLQTSKTPPFSKRDSNTVRRYPRSYTYKHSTSPEIVKRETSPLYFRANSSTLRRHSPNLRVHTSPEHSKSDSCRAPQSSLIPQSSGQWSQVAKRSDQSRKRSPIAPSAGFAANGRSPKHSYPAPTAAARRQEDSSAVSRDRRSLRHRR